MPAEGRYAGPRFHQEKAEGLATEAPSIFIMQKFCLISGRKSVFGMLVAFGLAVLVPSLWAQQNKAGSDSPQAAWSTIQQLVKEGFIAEAYRELQPMVARVQRTGGFHEWWSRDNQPRCSGDFRGSAGVLGRAIELLQEWAQTRAGQLP